MKNAKYTMAFTAAALMTVTAPAAANGELNIYNWGNYTNPDLIDKFEEETGIDVTLTDYDSNDTALARIRQGGHGYDIVVPSNSYVPIWIEEGLIQKIDRDIVTNMDNIDDRWVDVEFDPNRDYTVPWAWGTTGVTVNTSVYDGNPHTADIFLDPPDELKGKVNVVPEMGDIMHMAVRAAGGEPCTGDEEVLREVRDTLMKAKPHWRAMDYGTVDSYAAGDIAAGVNWNGSSMRSRLQNPNIVYGYPQTGYPVWMDNVAVLADAESREEAMKFVNFILEPENAAMISNFARYANGVEGSREYLDEVMKEAPEINIPDELADAGRFSVTCPSEVNDIYTQIWTELLQ